MKNCKVNVRYCKLNLRIGGCGKYYSTLVHLTDWSSTSVTSSWIVTCLLTLLVKRAMIVVHLNRITQITVLHKITLRWHPSTGTRDARLRSVLTLFTRCEETGDDSWAGNWGAWLVNEMYHTACSQIKLSFSHSLQCYIFSIQSRNGIVHHHTWSIKTWCGFMRFQDSRWRLLATTPLPYSEFHQLSIKPPCTTLMCDACNKRKNKLVTKRFHFQILRLLNWYAAALVITSQPLNSTNKRKLMYYILKAKVDQLDETDKTNLRSESAFHEEQ